MSPISSPAASSRSSRSSSASSSSSRSSSTRAVKRKRLPALASSPRPAASTTPLPASSTLMSRVVVIGSVTAADQTSSNSASVSMPETDCSSTSSHGTTLWTPSRSTIANCSAPSSPTRMSASSPAVSPASSLRPRFSRELARTRNEPVIVSVPVISAVSVISAVPVTSAVAVISTVGSAVAVAAVVAVAAGSSVASSVTSTSVVTVSVTVSSGARGVASKPVVSSTGSVASRSPKPSSSPRSGVAFSLPPQAASSAIANRSKAVISQYVRRVFISFSSPSLQFSFFGRTT